MFGNRMKHSLVFASLISPSKMILFEKKYQTFDTVFHHQMKHLEVRQKYSAARHISTLFSVFHLVMKHCISCLIYYMKHREESWKYDAQRSIFWRTSMSFIWWWNTLSNAWYYFSNKLILGGELKDDKMSSFSSDFQTLTNL